MTRSLRPDRLAAPILPVAPARLRKPRFLIAGEFSAGKTQLITGLLGEAVLPSNVTSTALPPVWLVGGAGAAMAVQPDGALRAVEQVAEFRLEDTQYGVIPHAAPILEQIEVIDTPGNSDPNIPPETWQRMVAYADAVIWCTNATQAWRQSEKSVWLDMPEALRASATLIVTHADRIGDQRAAARVMRRLEREAGEFFAHMMMASLLSEMDIARIAEHILAVAGGLDALPGADNPVLARIVTPPPRKASTPAVKPRRVRNRKAPAAPVPEVAPALPDLAPQDVVPHYAPAPQPAALAAPATDSDQFKFAPVAEDTAPAGPAAQLWRALGGETAQDDLDSLRARIALFIARLDAAPPAAEAAEDPPVPDPAPPHPAPDTAYYEDDETFDLERLFSDREGAALRQSPGKDWE